MGMLSVAKLSFEDKSVPFPSATWERGSLGNEDHGSSPVAVLARGDGFNCLTSARPARHGCGHQAMDLKSFFAELKRRNVYRVAVAYAVVGWLLIQIATQVFPFFEISNGGVRLVLLLIIIGFPIALVIAWVFEFTPEGLKRT